MNLSLQIDPNDNVCVALRDLFSGTVVNTDLGEITLRENIPAKHKFFLEDLAANDEIRMYGVLVGRAVAPILKGSLMNRENTRHAARHYEWRNCAQQWAPPDISRFRDRYFQGYGRPDGRVGTANYWLFIPMVFCENRNLEVIREVLLHELGYAVTGKYKLRTRQMLEWMGQGNSLDLFIAQEIPEQAEKMRIFPQVDGVKFLIHQGGCGGTRSDAAILGKLLAAYADHPNVGGVTVFSLGCQNLQTEQFLQELNIRSPKFNKPMYVFEQQESQSEEQLITEAILKTLKGLEKINQSKREPFPLSKLCVGVKCGGSDGFSGITANPAMGYAADLLVALGGKILLAEFPELHGVEQELVDRCTEQRTGEKFIRLMKEYESIAQRAGSGFYDNPSPGNIRDGLITDAIKSAGAAKKGGTSPIVDVLAYTEPAKKDGLSLVCTPGNDVEATTGKAASGATLILFSTGLGTPTGNPVAPTIKISTNTQLAGRMKDIIDIDAGKVLDGTSLKDMGEEILEFCIRAASGEIVPRAVALNQDDFIPWRQGVSL